MLAIVKQVVSNVTAVVNLVIFHAIVLQLMMRQLTNLSKYVIVVVNQVIFLAIALNNRQMDASMMMKMMTTMMKMMSRMIPLVQNHHPTTLHKDLSKTYIRNSFYFLFFIFFNYL